MYYYYYYQGANSSATQPTIAVAEDGGFAVAWEQEPVRHLKFSYYKNWDDLVSGHVSQQYDTPQTLSKCAEGTPHFYYASSTYLDVGHHFYNNCDTDREARGSLVNFSTWTTHIQTHLSNSVRTSGQIGGNIGDRDSGSFRGHDFMVIEAQKVKGDFGTWHIYLYDAEIDQAQELNVKTHKGSKSLANPSITHLLIDGKPTILLTMFIFGEGAGQGEAGALIYYKTY